MTDRFTQNDALLSAARLVAGAVMALLAIVAVGMVVGTVFALTIARDDFIGNLASDGFGPLAYPLMITAFAILSVLAALGFLFMRALLRILRSVEQGDPFQPVNADRLRQMAWLALGGLALGLVLTGIGIWFDGKESALAGDVPGTVITGLTLTLTLFALARVFRLGTAMREELEGTI